MSDKFSNIPLSLLLEIILKQYKSENKILGIPKALFFEPNIKDTFRFKRFGKLMETPIGVAAGPHTQMAQNIIAAWLTGARYIELKTIQTLDELNVSKPCIDMQDEGYNCEWSQELKIKEAFDQYLNAWIIIYILKDVFAWNTDESGFIFNMSVGYNLEGILKDNVQWFFNKMADASLEITEKINSIKNIYPNVTNLNIKTCLSNNITLSTMHGCPPDEIEQITEYLISKKKLHTAIKLNPTLLGEKELGQILENSGFETKVPDIAFEHDLKYADALQIIRKMQKTANEHNVQFSLKLTNTLESINHKNIFPAHEKMMYASGRVLHPISITLANKLQNEFAGKLDISFSAGLDAFNVVSVVKSNLYPATVCTDILKPGGYGRLKQYIEQLRQKKISLGNGKSDNSKDAFLNLKDYAKEVLKDSRYKKSEYTTPNIKTKRFLNSFDCIYAPCEDTCPTNQNIPSYMYYTAHGKFDMAYNVIKDTNPFPNSTGMVCDHVCQTKCTRINYDNPLLIREIKRFIAENANLKIEEPKIENNQKKIAIIGAGPSGLSCAYYLVKAGFKVDVYEQKGKSGGMLSGAIPTFRLSDKALKIDIKQIEKNGVCVYYNFKVDRSFFEKLRKDCDYIYIAAGAQGIRNYSIQGIDAKGVLNPLKFLMDTKEGKQFKLGKKVAVVGGGNTAMDSARTAKRLVGNTGKVSIIYRRTKKQMPANFIEIEEVQQEGIEILELLEPVKAIVKNGKLHSISCVKMKLGNNDESGRAKPEIIRNSEFELAFDTLIPAIGQNITIDFVNQKLLKQKKNSFETQINHVFIGGDALNGGLSAIAAIGDGRKAAQEIIDRSKVNFQTKHNLKRPKSDVKDLMLKKTSRMYGESPKELALSKRNGFDLIVSTLSKEEAIKEASRCLLCDELCNICTTVCPNLAFHAYEIQPVKYNLQKIIKENGAFKIVSDKFFEVKQEHQILHIADWCNQCGNCNTFCPSAGAPYKEKPHLHLTKKTFNTESEGYYLENENILLYKYSNRTNSLSVEEKFYIYKDGNSEIKVDRDKFEIKSYDIGDNDEMNLQIAAEMNIVMRGILSFFAK